MDQEKFDQWSDQFQTMMRQLQHHQAALQSITQTMPLADSNDLSTSSVQLDVEKQLRKMSNDIRALGFCYNKLSDAVKNIDNSKEKQTADFI